MWLRSAPFLAVLISGCVGPATEKQPTVGPPGPTTIDVTGDSTPPVPTDFTPDPQLPDPLPGDPRVFGAAYLEILGAEIAPRWSSFLEDLRVRLPPTHALNDKTLIARVSFVVDSTGALDAVAVDRPSGRAEFDASVLEVLADAAPLQRPPEDVLGDDDVARLLWTFARDERQAGLAGARLTPVRWPAARAVPKLVAAGKLDAAASRVLAAEGVEEEARAELLDQVARARVRVAAADGNVPAIQFLPDDDIRAIAKELAVIADTKGAPGRTTSLAALGRVSMPAVADAAEKAIRALKTPEEVVVAATAAWATLGDEALAEITAGVEELLSSGDPLRRRRAFVIASAAPIAAVARDAALLVSEIDALGLAVPVIVRMAQSGDRAAVRLIVRQLGDKVAERRAAFASGLARIDAPLPTSLRAAIERGLRDADERVRAGALGAIAKSWPNRVARAASRFRRESSPLVLTALANALAVDRSRAATRALTRLLSSDEATVRASAARGLWSRPKAASTLSRLVADPDERVARAALPGRTVAELRELALQRGSLASDALSAHLSLSVESSLAAQLMTGSSVALSLDASLAWLAARKRARLGG